MEEMYNWDKSFREDKSRRNTQIPSFSSTLLDEIYRSIDGGDENFGGFKLRKQKTVKKQNVKSGGGRGGGRCGGRGRFKNNREEEDEEIASLRRACLVDKWMEMKGNEKITVGCRHPSILPEIDPKLALDNDPLFFSSGSSSSDSSFGWHTEGEAIKPKHSVKKQSEFSLFNDDQTDKPNHNGLTKTRALKIYTSLKKVKQPTSPGGRLTTFLNAIFANGYSKKQKDSGFEDKTQTRSKRKSKSTNVSTCSSASSFSRSCLSKKLPSSRDCLNNGIPRTVQFVDHREKCNKHDFAMIPPTYVRARTEKQKFTEFSTKYDYEKFDYDNEDDDMASDSSSDLFELDHLAIFMNEEYCEELPVYETTRLGTNRAMV